MNNSELKIFNYKNNEVRTTIKDGEIWWVLKDVCQILGITNHKDIILKLEPDEKGVEKSTPLVELKKQRLSMKQDYIKLFSDQISPKQKNSCIGSHMCEP